MILPPATLGMLGGGQLGRFFVIAAHELGYRVVVLDPDPQSPAGRIADRHLVAAYDDEDALNQMAESCAAVTTEFENVPAGSLAYLSKFLPVRPSAEAVAISQNRSAEKGFLRQHGFPHAPYADIRSEDDIAQANAGLFPGILKVARFGYDGKGQVRVAGRDEALLAFRQLKNEPCVLEQMLPLDYEVSVVLSRDAAGGVKCFPVAENSHRHGILDISIVPARTGGCMAGDAQEIAEGIAQEMGYVGTLAVEFFVVRGQIAGQRNGAAAAQLRALHDRCLRQQPVRAAGAGADRPAAGRGARAFGRRDGESAGRPLVPARPAPRPRARLGATAGRAQPQAAPLRQAPRPSGTQDGPLHGDRQRCAGGAKVGAGGTATDRHRR
jgi:phosphoribosylaminoimidazole carboxylase PurK protein